ncbi:hypothetical protein [Thiosulfatimonas sediminis]|nr:hypothetical protein [Thiosulfatimonas sediminis]
MSSIAKDQLILLSHSKNMLLLAQQHKFAELEVLQKQWQPLLEKMLNRYGEQLNIVRAVLLEDAQQMERVLLASQAELGQHFLQSVKANKSVRKYVEP